MRSLRAHLLMLVLGAMLPGTLLTGVLVWRAFADARQTTERRLLESARVDASALDREFEDVISILDALASSPTLDAGDLAGFHAESHRLRATQPGWYTILLLSPEGRQLVNTRLDWGTALPPVVEPESLQRLVESRRPTVGVVRPAPQEERDLVFAVRVPVMRGNELKYVLSAVIRAQSLERLVPAQWDASVEWTRAVIDSEGTIAVRTRAAEEYVGSRATDAFRDRLRRAPDSVTAETTREGIPVYAATSRSKYGWTSIIVVPQAVLDGTLIASTTAILLGGALLMISGLAAVLFVSRRLTSDITAATLAADAVASGRPPTVGVGVVAETRRLHRSLASAASLLDERSRERDQEIRRAEEALADAERANRTKDQFLAVLGHELRNPLAPALTALEIMRARDPRVFTREREILERQIAHMTRLVNDLLDVARLARGQTDLVRRRFALRDAVDRAVDMVQPLVGQKRHTLHVNVPPQGVFIDGDIDRIVQVLSNLLNNAAKYTPPRGRITLSAAVEAGKVRIACEDTGPGVPPDLLPSLFEPFAQGPQSFDRRQGGLGLGLTLARSLTALHGGQITVEPGSAGGSRFVVTLPIAEDATSIVPAGPVREVADARSARRVLVVDDNDDATEMLNVALGDAGHVVATAASGVAALAVADDFRPQVAVLDIGLPGMDGYELARRLRQTHDGIRLIALTGFGQAADVAAARQAGFDGHCAKPVRLGSLLRMIDGDGAPTARV
jgi:signal transduction histidine kinase/CheY-like chemotaxis protein